MPGGKREGAGRPLKYGEPLIYVHYRVPQSKKKTVDKIIRDNLKKWEVKKKNNQ